MPTTYREGKVIHHDGPLPPEDPPVEAPAPVAEPEPAPEPLAEPVIEPTGDEPVEPLVDMPKKAKAKKAAKKR